MPAAWARRMAMATWSGSVSICTSRMLSGLSSASGRSAAAASLRGATAWLAPLPPGCMERSVASRVCPGAGRSGGRQVRHREDEVQVDGPENDDLTLRHVS